MSEALLRVDDIAMRIRASKSTVLRNLDVLRAKGLQQVTLGSRLIRYRAASLDALIKRAAEREEPLF